MSKQFATDLGVTEIIPAQTLRRIWENFVRGDFHMLFLHMVAILKTFHFSFYRIQRHLLWIFVTD